MKHIKITLDEDEVAILDRLVKDIEVQTRVRTSRTAVVRGAYQYGFLVMRESYVPRQVEQEAIEANGAK